MARKANKIKLKIHPLATVIGCILILFGHGTEVAIYVSTLLLHEYGHYVVATSCGGVLQNTYITPFGSKLEAELFDLKPVDELKVAIAGPLVNLSIVVILYALWWQFPTTYPYTELIANANLAIATVNLFPSYPLDGGRALNVLLKIRFKERAEKIMQVFGIASSVFLSVIFVLLLKTTLNWTLAMMAVFMFLGSTVDLRRDNQNRKILGNALGGMNFKGKEVKRVTVEPDSTLYELVKMLDNSYFYEFDIYENGEKISSFNEIRLKKWIMRNNYNEKLKKILK